MSKIVFLRNNLWYVQRPKSNVEYTYFYRVLNILQLNSGKGYLYVWECNYKGELPIINTYMKYGVIQCKSDDEFIEDMRLEQYTPPFAEKYKDHIRRERFLGEFEINSIFDAWVIDDYAYILRPGYETPKAIININNTDDSVHLRANSKQGGLQWKAFDKLWKEKPNE